MSTLVFSNAFEILIPLLNTHNLFLFSFNVSNCNAFTFFLNAYRINKNRYTSFQRVPVFMILHIILMLMFRCRHDDDRDFFEVTFVNLRANSQTYCFYDVYRALF